MTLQFDYGSLMIKATPSYQVEFQNLLHFVLFGTTMFEFQLKRKNPSTPSYQVEFRNLPHFVLFWITMFEFQLKRKDPPIVESQSIWSFGN